VRCARNIMASHWSHFKPNILQPFTFHMFRFHMHGWNYGFSDGFYRYVCSAYFAPNLTATTVNSKLWWCRLLTYREVERWRHRDGYRRHISASATVSRDLVIPSSPVPRYHCITDKHWTTAADADDAGAFINNNNKETTWLSVQVTWSPYDVISSVRTADVCHWRSSWHNVDTCWQLLWFLLCFCTSFITSSDARSINDNHASETTPAPVSSSGVSLS